MSMNRIWLIIVGFLMLSATPAYAAGGNTDIEGSVFLVYAGIAAFSYICSILATKIGQAGVVGALVGGVVLSFVAYFTDVIQLPDLTIITTVGMVIILFEAGLHARVEDMLKELGPSASVAVVGVVVPALAGSLFGIYYMGLDSTTAWLTVGVTLTATSVGVSYKVFGMLKMETSREANIVIGAAVIDDILGMAFLAALGGVAVSSAEAAGSFDFLGALKPLGIGLAYVIGFSAIGYFLNKSIPGEKRSLVVAVLIMGVALWLATELGIALIIAGFVAGFVITAEKELDTVVKGLGIFLYAPAFLAVGLLVDFSVMSWDMLVPILLLSVIAFITKLVAGFAAPSGTNKMLIGAGMASRGEVGLAVAAIALAENWIDQETFAILTGVIIVVTIAAPVMMSMVGGRKAAAA